MMSVPGKGPDAEMVIPGVKCGMLREPIAALRGENALQCQSGAQARHAAGRNMPGGLWRREIGSIEQVFREETRTIRPPSAGLRSAKRQTLVVSKNL
jgi:hypothetical protein